MAHRDDTTLLCETCGYALAGLDADSACPECGTPVAESLPDRRPGSAWQRRGRRAWGRTMLDYLNRPREEFRGLTIERRRSLRLLVTSTLVAAIVAALPWAVLALLMTSREPKDAFVVFLIALSVAGLGWCVLLGASWIESVGIRFFGRRRGWRVTRDVAAAVCGHAAVGWVAGAVFVLIAAGVAGVVGFTDREGARAGVRVMITGWALGALIGLVWFEILVYRGVRQCRFANPPGAALARQPTPANPSAPGAPPESGAR
jgi:hypothetical protein